MPQKSFRLNAQDNAALKELAKRLRTNQTDAVRKAIRDMTVRLRRGEPVYLSDPDPPTRRRVS